MPDTKNEIDDPVQMYLDGAAEVAGVWQGATGLVGHDGTPGTVTPGMLREHVRRLRAIATKLAAVDPYDPDRCCGDCVVCNQRRGIAGSVVYEDGRGIAVMHAPDCAWLLARQFVDETLNGG